MQTFLSIVLGFVAGIAGSLIAPWVNWGVEKRRQKLAHRRELISRWRKMIRDVTLIKDGSERTLAELLERQEAFYSLQPHLSQKVISEIYRSRTVIAGSTIDAGCSYILDEIGEIEKRWTLV
jgi:predicted YcjX-like family ATPase